MTDTEIKRQKQWLRMVIKAFESLEREACDDCISRQAVLEKAINVPLAKMVSEDKVIYRKVIFADDIEKLPSVTSQPKIGHWIFVDEAHEHARCSNCDYGDVDLMDGKSHNYCPNCGYCMVDTQER